MNLNTAVIVTGMSCFLTLSPASRATTAPAAATLDSGGQRVASTSITIDGSVGGIGSSATTGIATVKPGYAGQLTDVAALSVTASSNPVNEGGTSQLGGLARMDDATIILLNGNDTAWSAPLYPVASISSNGLATMAIVYGGTSGTVTGRYLGVTGTGSLLVLDNNTDNYDIYAGDQVHDGWQVAFFGTNNPLGMGTATNSSGLLNRDSYIADLDPTNAAARLAIMAISNQAPNFAVYFAPASTSRVYALQSCTNLASGSWTNVTPVTNWGNGGTCLLVATNHEAALFYRIAVQLP